MRIFGLDIQRAEPGIFRSRHYTGMGLGARIKEAVNMLEDEAPGDPASTKKILLERTERAIDEALAERAKRNT